MVFLTVACSIYLSGGTSPNPTIKGRNAAKNSPTKKFLIVYSFLSDAEIRCYRRKISPGGRRFFCLPSACAILLSAGFDIL